MSALQNIVTLLIKSKDGKRFVCSRKNNTLNLPYMAITFEDEGWKYQAQQLATKTMSIEVADLHPIRVYNFFCPHHEGLKNIVYEILLDEAQVDKVKFFPSSVCPKLKWTPVESVVGSEIFQLKYWKDVVLGVGQVGVIKEFTKDEFIINEDNINRALYDLLLGAIMTQADQMNLLQLFLSLTWPEIYMTQEQFLQFGRIIFNELEEETFLMSIYHTAIVPGSEYLKFQDLVLIYAACDIATPHSGVLSEMRCRYIFRLYDKDNKGEWSIDDLQVVIRKIYERKHSELDDDTLEREIQSAYSAFNVTTRDNIPLQNFLIAVGELKFRGTSGLLRFKHNFRLFFDNETSIQSKCIKRYVSYTKPKLARHVLKFCDFGADVDIKELWTQTEFVSLTSIRLLKIERDRCKDSVFNIIPIVEEVLNGLKSFCSDVASFPKRKGEKQPFSWGNVSLDMFGEALIEICEQLTLKLAKEPRCLSLESPVYVFGDVHGNFQDLVAFERMLWHLSPTMNPCKILFLGDYVDRGPCSVEVIAYLFAYKYKSYDKIQMIRGNHEIRDVQRMFSFYSECIMKFGNSVGNRVFTAVNNVFDSMPLAAVIDGSIFCAHGGIPPPWIGGTLAALATIPCPLPLPDEQSQLAWNLMWNDPLVEGSDIEANIKLEMSSNGGFTRNRRRGTGYIFDEHALNAFLQKNQLTHLIRAHETQPYGVSVQYTGKLISIFSTSNYCGMKNDCACLLIESNKIRILRMDVDGFSRPKAKK